MSVRSVWGFSALLAFGGFACRSPASAAELVEPPSLEAAVQAGDLPPVAERMPEHPYVVSYEGTEKTAGKYGGTLRILGGSAKDTRLMVIYGYARLVAYTPNFDIVPDIAESVDIRGRPHLHLPSSSGPQMVGRQAVHLRGFPLLLGGHGERPGSVALRAAEGAPGRGREAGRRDSPDETTVRYTWSKPNSFFLPALAAAQPVEIFRPGALPEAVPCQICRPGSGEEDGRGGGRAELGRAALQQGPLLPERQPRLPDAAALGAEDTAAVRPLHLRAQSLFPSRRRGRPAASLYRRGGDHRSRVPT